MGTVITLDLDGASLTYAKNYRGMDHGVLFLEEDRRRVPSEQVNYDYFREENVDPGPMEMAFVRKLRDVVPRLELLGFTLDEARKEYELRAAQWKEDNQGIADPGETTPDPLSFDEFCAFAIRYAIAELDSTSVVRTEGPDADPRGRFAKDEARIARIPADSDDFSWSERSYFANRISVLHPYFILRILGENSTNLAGDVVWQYGPLVEGGYAAETDFKPLARRTDTFLIATEGSSDVHILRQALRLLRPDVADFFRFVDVSDGHPFSGTGNLVKFASGLAKIDVHNQTVFVFDNDAEGTEAYKKVAGMTLPNNMSAMLLPSLDAFKSFPSKGPQGDHDADINGRAAAIECYLDHRFKEHRPARVTWTNYKDKSDTYHGVLDHKESYVDSFLDLEPGSFESTGYDTGKIEVVLDALIGECTSIAESELETRLQSDER